MYGINLPHILLDDLNSVLHQHTYSRMHFCTCIDKNAVHRVFQ